jgi:hypothetical protein
LTVRSERVDAKVNGADGHDGRSGGECVHGVDLELYDKDDEDCDGGESKGNKLPLLRIHDF